MGWEYFLFLRGYHDRVVTKDKNGWYLTRQGKSWKKLPLILKRAESWAEVFSTSGFLEALPSPVTEDKFHCWVLDYR